MAELELLDVTKRVGRFKLGPVTMSIGPGITALLGANGAGKSTLIRVAIGALRPGRGSVLVDGEVLRRSSTGVGYLPQDFAGPKNLRVDEYMHFIAWCRSTRRRRIGSGAISDALAAVGLSDRVHDRIGELSGGMVRRLGVAQALLGESGVIVLDEPTVGLDPAQRRDLRDLLTRLATDHAILLSTHLSEDVASVASTVHVLERGAPVFSGSAVELATLGNSSGNLTGEAIESGFLAVAGGSDA